MAERSPPGPDAGGAASPLPDRAPPAITISPESYPGLCLGLAVVASAAIEQVGYSALTEAERSALSGALLKNIAAWDLLALDNPRVAAGVELAGVLVGIIGARVMNEKRKRPVQTVGLAAPVDVFATPPAAGGGVSLRR